MTDTPERGTPEYDQMMAEKYRRQKDGPTEEYEDPASSYRQVEAPDGRSIGVHKDSTLGPPDRQPYSKEMADPGQVITLERDIERLQAELARVAGRDPATGQPIPWYTGAARHAKETQLAFLVEVQLPYVKELQRQAAEWVAANTPSAQDKLMAERDRREAIRLRAEELADEQEAREAAQKLLERRRNQRG